MGTQFYVNRQHGFKVRMDIEIQKKIIDEYKKGESVRAICRKLSLSEASVQNAVRGYLGIDHSDLLELARLKKENKRLQKKLKVVEEDKELLKEVLSGKYQGPQNEEE